MDFLALAGRVILSLAVVLLVLWLAARVLGKKQRRTSRGVDVDVLARQPLAQRASVAVVKVGDRALILGVTESRVELLSEQPISSVLTIDEPQPMTFRATLDADDLPNLSDLPDLPELSTASALPDGVSLPLPTQVTKPVAKPVASPARGPLAGSALSPATWSKALEAVREMTVRK